MKIIQLFIAIFIGGLANISHAQQPTWMLQDDISTQQMISLDDDQILFIGFWKAELRSNDGQLVRTLEYPDHWIADCTSNFYDNGLIKHLDFFFTKSFEAIDLDGNIVTSLALDPNLPSDCWHDASIFQVDENTLVFRDPYGDNSAELLLDEMEYSIRENVSVSVLDGHFIHLHPDYFFVGPIQFVDGENYLWEGFYESDHFWFTSPNQINFIINEENELDRDHVMRTSYDNKRITTSTLQRRYSENLVRDRSEIIGQLHGEVNSQCQYSAFFFNEVIQIMVGDPSEPLHSILLDHDNSRITSWSFSSQVRIFSLEGNDLIIKVGKDVFGFSTVCEQTDSNEDQVDMDETEEENMENSENTPQFFQETYPWINSNIIGHNCGALTISEYDLGAFSFIYLSDGRLYFEDGTFYCQTTATRDCRSLYELTNERLSNEWICTEETTNVPEEENTQTNNEVVEKYPWLLNVDLPSACLIEEYDLGPFAYVYVIIDNIGTLYFDDGSVFCQSSNSRDCRPLYNLVQDQITNSWSCELSTNEEDKNDQEQASELFTDYNWIGSIISADCMTGAITEYISRPFTFILIETEESSNLYFQDGTYYCNQTESYNCIEAYSLTEVGRTFACGANFKDVEMRNKDYEYSAVVVSPNPTTSIINVRIPSNHSSIELISSNGKLLKSQKNIDVGQYTFDLIEFNEGIYFVRIISGENMITKKIVKI